MKARIFAEENRKWWTLAAVAFGLFMIMLDNTVVNVALPSIARDLHISISELEWIVTGYALVFAASDERRGPSLTPAAVVAAIIASQSATEAANGFSHRTWTPTAAARVANSRCM